MAVRFSGSSVVFYFNKKTPPDPQQVETAQRAMEETGDAALLSMGRWDSYKRYGLVSQHPPDRTLLRLNQAQEVLNILVPGNVRAQEKLGAAFSLHPNDDTVKVYA